MLSLVRKHFLFLATLATLITVAASPATPATRSKDVHNSDAGLWQDKTFSLDSDLHLGNETGADYEVFGRIMDIAINSAGHILVLDNSCFCVREFDEDGRYVRSMGRQGEGPGEFSFPSALAIDRSDRVYVADAGGRVDVFDSSGAYLTQFKHVHPGNIIRAIRVAPNGTIFVSCFEPVDQQIIHEYDSSYHFMRSFCDSYAIGQDLDVRIEGVFAGGPIDIGPDSNIYFSQMLPYEITKYSPDGVQLMTIYRDNSFVSEPGVIRGKDGMTITAPTGSVSIVLLSDGKFLNVVKKPPVPEPPAVTILDLFDKNGKLLTSRRLERDMNIKCRDAADRLYSIEMDNVPSVVRYRTDL